MPDTTTLITLDSEIKESHTRDCLANTLRSRLYCETNILQCMNVMEDEWEEFARSWDNLSLDVFMQDGGKYRRRRFTELAYNASTGAISVQPHRPFYQSLEFNTLNGGLERHFEPVTSEVLKTAILGNLVRYLAELFTTVSGVREWDVNVHQVRIEASTGSVGLPVPEGIHRDGVTFTSLILIRRHNVLGAENMLFDDGKRLLLRRFLTKPGDALIIDDMRTYHDTTSVRIGPDGEFEHRDMLFLEFKATR